MTSPVEVDWLDPKTAIPLGGIVVSLVWNAFNTWFAHRNANKKSRRDARTSEFSAAIRIPILTELNSIENVKASLLVLRHGRKPIKVEERLKAIQRQEAQPIYENLQNAVDVAEQHPMFKDKLSLNDTLSDSWDKVLNAFSRAYNSCESAAALHASSVEIETALNDMSKNMRAALSLQATEIINGS